VPASVASLAPPAARGVSSDRGTVRFV
jgi:hypothetical protein